MKSRRRNVASLESRVILDNDSASSSESSKTSSSNSSSSGILDSESISHEKDTTVYTPRISGGCIISERPIFLKNSVLCVVNNRKCTLYSSQDARRLCDTLMNSEMIIGSRSFIYGNDYEILLCAASNGIILVYHVPNYIHKANYHTEELERRELDLIARLRVECKSLLSIEVNKESGDIICVIVTQQLKTEIIKVTLNYDRILFTDSSESSNEKGDDVIHIRTFDSSECGSVDDGISGVGVNNKELIIEYKKIVSLESNLEVFEVDSLFSRVALGVGKSCLVIDLKTEQSYYFENYNVITCIAFDGKGAMAMGDASGQIVIISTLDKSCFVNTNYNSTVSFAILGFKLSNEIKMASLSTHLSLMKKNSKTNKELSTSGVKSECVLGRVETKRLHWHSHGVNCICYNEKNVNMLLSGGEEGVVVSWDLVNHSKKFVTRLGAPIFHIALSEDQTILASIQNNSIIMIDPTSLSIRGKVSSLIIDLSLCDGCSEVGRVIDYYPNNCVKQMFENQESQKDHESVGNMCTGRNSIVIANMNKLQLYDYIRDCETKLIDVSSVNYVSRQDEEFGQHYHITNLCVSQDCKYIVIVQSRSVKIELERDNYELEDNGNKYVLKFYNVKTTVTSGGMSLNEKNTERGIVKEKDCKVTSRNEEYVLQTNINNPHRKKVTSLKQLYHKNKFLSSSLDGKLNLYSLVELYDNKGTGAVEGKASSSTIRNQSREVWTVEHVVDYKSLAIHSVSINENDLILLKHDCVMSLWKYFESYESGLMNMKAMSLNMAQDVFYVEFVSHESILLCTRKRISIYNIKNNAKSLVLETGNDEEVNLVLLKYNIMVVNIRKFVQNANYVDYMEIYTVNNKNKLYSKIVKGLNSRFDIKLLPYQVQTMCASAKKRKRESISRPLCKDNRIYYHLLIINESTNDIEIMPIIKKDGNYTVDDKDMSVKVRCKKIKREDSQVNHLAKFIQNMLNRSIQNASKSNKRKYNLCNKYYRQSSYKCKRIDAERVSELYNSSEKIPRPNVLLDHIINNLV